MLRRQARAYGAKVRYGDINRTEGKDHENHDVGVANRWLCGH